MLDDGVEGGYSILSFVGRVQDATSLDRRKGPKLIDQFAPLHTPQTHQLVREPSPELSQFKDRKGDPIAADRWAILDLLLRSVAKLAELGKLQLLTGHVGGGQTIETQPHRGKLQQRTRWRRSRGPRRIGFRLVQHAGPSAQSQ